MFEDCLQPVSQYFQTRRKKFLYSEMTSSHKHWYVMMVIATIFIRTTRERERKKFSILRCTVTSSCPTALLEGWREREKVRKINSLLSLSDGLLKTREKRRISTSFVISVSWRIVDDKKKKKMQWNIEKKRDITIQARHSWLITPANDNDFFPPWTNDASSYDPTKICCRFTRPVMSFYDQIMSITDH